MVYLRYLLVSVALELKCCVETNLIRLMWCVYIYIGALKRKLAWAIGNDFALVVIPVIKI